MSKKRTVYSPVPFHRSVVDQMNNVMSRTKNAAAQAVCLAALIRRTSCPPAHCEEVKNALSAMIKRLGGFAAKKGVKKVFTTSQISEFLGAFETLKNQAQAHLHSVSGTQQGSSSASGEGHKPVAEPMAAVG